LERKDVVKIADRFCENNINELVDDIGVVKVNSYDKSHDPFKIIELFESRGITKVFLVEDLTSFLCKILDVKNEKSNSKELIFICGSLKLCSEVLQIDWSKVTK
jgi:folylpolyglutamate synthase/dihydropteroate synthase